jgi:predicted glycoside hydrolase/deacetylase ChbG (UPF0249 family)
LSPPHQDGAIRLVVNADDLGLHPSIDRGILRAHREGIVTSATVLVTGRCAPEAIAHAVEQRLPLGVHLCLTTNLPPAAEPSSVRSLAPNGRLRARWPQVLAAWAMGRIDVREIELEFRAQIALARKRGARPDHLDGHQHLHVLPGVAGAVRSIAREEGLPVRWPIAQPSASWLFHPASAVKTAGIGLLSGIARRGAAGLSGLGTFEAGKLTEDRLAAIISRLAPGDHEIGCHPGEMADEVPEQRGWRYGWETELNALCSPRVRALIQERSIALVSYGQLQ